MPATDDQLRALDDLLDGAVLLGAELDLTYRVLGLTVEVEDARHPAGPGRDDRRLQVLLHPASTIVASLRVLAQPPRVEAFDVEQLPDVVHALDGPLLRAPLVGVGPPDAGEWGPQPSLEGRSKAPDGHRHRFRLDVESAPDGGDVRHFGLHATFDDVEVRGPDGDALEIG